MEPALNRALIETAKDTVNLIEIAQEQGVEFKGDVDDDRAYCKCPFHDDGHASMMITPRYACCFATGCGWSGDIIDWMQHREGWDFQTATRWLCERAGVRWSQPNGRDVQALQAAQQQNKHISVVEKAAEIYRGHLDGNAYQYALDRGISSDMITKFGLGFCPPDHDTIGVLADEGFQPGLVREAKLVVGKQADRPRLADKLVIPITWWGRVVNLYGRDITGEDRLPHDYVLRHKMCWGWDQCRKDKRVRKNRMVFGTEGLIDALVAWSAGIPSVALYGTKAMRRVWFKRIRRAGVDTFVFIPDADGREGREAALEISSLAMAEGLRVIVADTPPGEDPASLGCQDYAELRRVCREAVKKDLTAYEYAEQHGLITHDSSPLLRSDDGELLLDCSGYSIRVHNWRDTRDGVTAVISTEREGRAVHRDKLNTWAARSRSMFAKSSGFRDADQQIVQERLMRLGDELINHDGHVHDEPEDEITSEIDDRVRESAEEFLRSPDLLKRIAADITNMGYVGEDRAKVLMYLIATGRLMEDPIHSCVMSASSSGKSALVKAITKMMPDEAVVEMSAMSSKALYHLDQGALAHRWVIMAERTGYDEIANHAVRLLQSEGHLRYAVAIKNEQTGSIETVEKEIDGPMAWTETTTDQENDLNPENLNRMVVIYLDESEDQTRMIHEYQRMMVTEEAVSLESLRQGIIARHRAAQTLLRRGLRVIVPFARHIDFPVEFVRARRDLQKVLNIVSASATLHQYQREQRVIEGVDVVVADPFDYRVAHGLYSLLLRQAYVGLPKKSEELLSIIGKNITDLVKDRNGIDPTSLKFRRRDVQEWSGWPLRQISRALEPLEEAEILEAQYDGGRGSPAAYLLTAAWNGYGGGSVAGMTSPRELERRIAKENGHVGIKKRRTKKKVARRNDA
jgi:DNA primase catalytic core